MDYSQLPDVPHAVFYKLNPDHTTEACKFGEYIRWQVEEDGWNAGRLAFDEFEGGLMISTIFLGIDHGFGMTEKPVLFETMVLSRTSGALLTDRYASYAAAMDGHRDTLARVTGSEAVRTALRDILGLEHSP
jgi:hypothetical protein